MARYERDDDWVHAPVPVAFALEWLSGFDRILELGPAGGHLTEALHESGAAVVCVEFDPDFAASLQEVADVVLERDLDAITAEELSKHGPFDAVVATDVLEHLRDPGRVVALLASVLRDDGVLVASVPNVAHADVRLALMSGNFNMTPEGLLDRTHLRFFTLESATEMLETNGFEITDVRRTVVPVGMTEQAEFCSPEFAELRLELADEPEADTNQFTFRAAKRGKPIGLTLREASLAREKAEAAAAEADELRHKLNVLNAELDGVIADRDRLQSERDHVEAEYRALAERLERMAAEVRNLPQTSRAVRLAATLTRLRKLVSPEAPTLFETFTRITEQQ